jgi:hypothetical protein
MCASIFFTHKKFKYYFILLLLLDVSFIFTRTRRVKVPAYFVSFGCCPVKRSADESGNISGPGLLGNRRLGSSWRLFSFMYDAWGSSAAKGGGPPGFQVYPSRMGVWRPRRNARPSRRTMLEARDKVFLLWASILFTGFADSATGSSPIQAAGRVHLGRTNRMKV